MKYLLLLLALLLIGCQPPEADLDALRAERDSLRAVTEALQADRERLTDAVARQVEYIALLDSLRALSAYEGAQARENMLIYEKPSDSLTADLNRIYRRITNPARRD